MIRRAIRRVVLWAVPELEIAARRERLWAAFAAAAQEQTYVVGANRGVDDIHLTFEKDVN